MKKYKVQAFGMAETTILFDQVVEAETEDEARLKATEIGDWNIVSEVPVDVTEPLEDSGDWVICEFLK